MAPPEHALQYKKLYLKLKKSRLELSIGDTFIPLFFLFCMDFHSRDITDIFVVFYGHIRYLSIGLYILCRLVVFWLKEVRYFSYVSQIDPCISIMESLVDFE